MTTPRYCSQCGAEQKNTANFCHSCGSRVAAAGQAVLPAASYPAASLALPWADSPAQSAAASAVLPWASSAPSATDRPCYSCGRSWGDGRACQFCRQVDGLPSDVILSSPLKRLAGSLLDTLIALCTLGIGWLVWSLIIYKDGQTPGKQLLGMRCAILETGRIAGWGRMFCREWLAKGLLFSVLLSISFGLAGILYFWLLWDKDKQQIWDKVVDTIVVDDPERLLQH